MRTFGQVMGHNVNMDSQQKDFARVAIKLTQAQKKLILNEMLAALSAAEVRGPLSKCARDPLRAEGRKLQSG